MATQYAKRSFLVVVVSAFLFLSVFSITYAASTIGTNMSTTGTFTQTVGSATAARFQNAAGTVTTLVVDTSNNRVGVGATPGTTFEVQGTASASYFFTQNTIQVGGAAASAAYSRFGTSVTGHSNYISTTNDLLISGDLEVRATASFGSVASVSGVFYLADGQVRPGTVGDSTTAFRFQNAAGTASVLTIDTTNRRIGIGTTPITTFEVQGTASASYFLTGNTLQVGGFASAAYSRFGTDTTTHAGTVSGANDLLISGGLEVNGSAAFDGFALFGAGASISTNFEITGNQRFGINAGPVTQTTFEVGGTASISGIASVSGNFSAGTANTGTSSFNFDTPSTTQGGCFRIKDNDGSGYTFLRVSNGVATFSTVDCR